MGITARQRAAAKALQLIRQASVVPAMQTEAGQLELKGAAREQIHGASERAGARGCQTSWLGCIPWYGRGAPQQQGHGTPVQGVQQGIAGLHEPQGIKDSASLLGSERS